MSGQLMKFPEAADVVAIDTHGLGSPLTQGQLDALGKALIDGPALADQAGLLLTDEAGAFLFDDSAAGVAGPPGIAGAAGGVGPAGAQGIQGIPGNDGAVGPSGGVGGVGPAGGVGPSGPAGPSPTGTGFAHVTVGVLDPAAVAIAESDVTNLTTDLAAKTTALNAHIADAANPHAVTKAQVGLGSVDNTADTAKPVSTAQQTALDLKANLASPTFSGIVVVPDASWSLAKLANMATASVFYRKTAGSGVPEVNTLATLKTDLALVKGDVGLGNVDNVADASKPVSTAQAAADAAVQAASQPLAANLTTYAGKTPPSGTVLGTTDTQTLSAKRIQQRANVGTTNAGPTPSATTDDIFILTAQSGTAAFAAPIGGVNGERLRIRIKDNGTARAITWNAIYRAVGCVLPTTTVLGKTLYLEMIYNATDTLWDVVAVWLEGAIQLQAAQVSTMDLATTLIVTLTVPTGANNGTACRVMALGSWSISNLNIIVGTQSGNIAVAIFRDNGAGAPGVLVATSGSVACGAAGVQTISLGGTFVVNTGDWIALVADNTSAKFGGVQPWSSNLPTWRAARFASTPAGIASNPTMNADLRVFAIWGS